MTKHHRQNIIRKLITTQDIDSQGKIVAKLQEMGLNVTQATVSRDVKELLLSKAVMPNGLYKYVLPGDQRFNLADRLKKLVNDVVVRIDCAQNLVVIKCFPGNGNAVAVLIDNSEFPDIIGCISGDDTVLLIHADNAQASQTKHFFDAMQT
jgi:transcriptional regulator of arginine metabolism